ncbi:helix-turn-helix domain-containing protein [Amorphus sp. MBR-141]
MSRRLDRSEILRLHSSGMTVAAIANALRCSRMQIYRILKDTE